VSAQSAKRATFAGTGTVSGRVFAITKGGDLKVAQLAHVYLFYSGSLKGAEENTAASTFTSALTSETDYHGKAWKAHVAEMQQRFRAQIATKRECSLRKYPLGYTRSSLKAKRESTKPTHSGSTRANYISETVFAGSVVCSSALRYTSFEKFVCTFVLAIQALKGLAGSSVARVGGRISAAGRARIAAASPARWAKRRDNKNGRLQN
jgi:hypothetical protein